MSTYKRDAGSKEDFTDKEKIEQIIKSDPVLTALYKRSIADTKAYADGMTNADVKPVLKALLILAWIMIRKLTRG